MSADPFALQRFVDAQAPVYERVRGELSAGAKASHWMWFIFPQHVALGRSATARHFGITTRDEAVAYLQHPLLGARLRECATLLLAVQGKSALEILGPPDDLKLRSSMTLFAQVAQEEVLFAAALERYFDGQPDEATLALLRDPPG